MAAPKRARSTIPLYLQIRESLLREIAAGRLKTGDRLPPERALAGAYNTTVRTLRKALSDLESKGVLERVQGSGNYVRDTKSASGIYSMFRLERLTGGGLPTAQVLSLSEWDKPGDLPQFGASHRATRIRRLRYLDNIAVALEEIWLDRDSGAVDPVKVSDSLYRYYELELGFWVHRAEDQVSVADAPDWGPDAFKPPRGAKVGYVQRLSWAQKSEPVEYSRTWFDPAKAVYIQRIT